MSLVLRTLVFFDLNVKAVHVDQTDNSIGYASFRRCHVKINFKIISH